MTTKTSLHPSLHHDHSQDRSLAAPAVLVRLLKTPDPPTAKVLRRQLRQAARQEAKAARTRPRLFDLDRQMMEPDMLRCLSLALTPMSTQA